MGRNAENFITSRKIKVDDGTGYKFNTTQESIHWRKDMSSIDRIKAGLSRRLETHQINFEKLQSRDIDDFEAMMEMDSLKTMMATSLSASSTYTIFRSEQLKVVIDGTQ